MIVEVKVIADDGDVVAEFSADALHPANWRTPMDKPLKQGDYQLFGFTYQPMVRLNSKRGGF